MSGQPHAVAAGQYTRHPKRASYDAPLNQSSVAQLAKESRPSAPRLLEYYQLSIFH